MRRLCQRIWDEAAGRFRRLTSSSSAMAEVHGKQVTDPGRFAGSSYARQRPGGVTGAGGVLDRA